MADVFGVREATILRLPCKGARRSYLPTSPTFKRARDALAVTIARKFRRYALKRLNPRPGSACLRHRGAHAGEQPFVLRLVVELPHPRRAGHDVEIVAVVAVDG